MKINDFKSEVFFDEWEFKAQYLLSLSDTHSMSIRDLLSYEPGSIEKLLDIWLGYTEVPGNPDLRGEIAKLYTTIDTNQIIVHSGAEEPIFNFPRVMLEATDHVIVMFPTYQSIYDVPRGMGCEVSFWEIKEKNKNWTLDINELRSLIKPNTKVIYINSPNNPTGYTLSNEELDFIVEVAKENDLYVFSDEVYHGLELDGQKRPLIADLYEKGISLNVMSKAYGMAGLRIGWVATKDRVAYEKITKAKHYTSVCNSCASEFLATIALKHGDEIIERNMKILRENLKIADAFFRKYAHLFEYIPPKGGTIAYFRMNIEQSIDDFCIELVKSKGIILLSANIYDTGGQYIRMGFGRENFKECLDQFEEYLIEKKYV